METQLGIKRLFKASREAKPSRTDAATPSCLLRSLPTGARPRNSSAWLRPCLAPHAPAVSAFWGEDLVTRAQVCGRAEASPRGATVEVRRRETVWRVTEPDFSQISQRHTQSHLSQCPSRSARQSPPHEIFFLHSKTLNTCFLAEAVWACALEEGMFLSEGRMEAEALSRSVPASRSTPSSKVNIRDQHQGVWTAPRRPFLLPASAPVPG